MALTPTSILGDSLASRVPGALGAAVGDDGPTTRAYRPTLSAPLNALQQRDIRSSMAPDKSETFFTDDSQSEIAEVLRLRNQIAVLHQRLLINEARLSALEQASGLFAGPRTLSPGFAYQPSGTTGLGPGPAVSMGPSAAAAAALSSRYGKLKSIAEGRQPQGRKPGSTTSGGLKGTSTASASSGSTAASPSMPQNRPITLRNGITLIKDRRLIGQMFLTRPLRSIFERIVETHFLRARPFISKSATAAQVDNAIYDSFKKLGHNLVADGQVGFEYGSMSSGDHRLMTLGPEGHPKQHLSGNEFAAEYCKRECYIIVKSHLPFLAYEELLWETAEVIDDDHDYDAHDGSGAARRSGANDFTTCYGCDQDFSRTIFAEHSLTCSGRDTPRGGRRNRENPPVPVKQEPDHDHAAMAHQEGPLFSPSGASSPLSSPDLDLRPNSCFCFGVEDGEIILCANIDCDQERHRVCLLSDETTRQSSFNADAERNFTQPAESSSSSDENQPISRQPEEASAEAASVKVDKGEKRALDHAQERLGVKLRPRTHYIEVRVSMALRTAEYALKPKSGGGGKARSGSKVDSVFPDLVTVPHADEVVKSSIELPQEYEVQKVHIAVYIQ
ncbi:hypothetical protein V8E36_009293 [Tilletia maclaganii]